MFIQKLGSAKTLECDRVSVRTFKFQTISEPNLLLCTVQSVILLLHSLLLKYLKRLNKLEIRQF